MNPLLLNSRQSAVMRFMFDDDAPAQAVTPRGIRECEELGLIHGAAEDHGLVLTEAGEAMRSHFKPTKELPAYVALSAREFIARVSNHKGQPHQLKAMAKRWLQHNPKNP